jgi:hypothetical protein
LEKDLFDKQLNVGEECHIISKQTGGPRHQFMKDFDYDDGNNLILLCCNHHKEIDTQIEQYPVERLRQIKTNHEKWVNENLDDDYSKIKELNSKSNILDKSALQGEFEPDYKIDKSYSISISLGESIKITMLLGDGETVEPFKDINMVNLPLALKVTNGGILVSCIFSNIAGKPVAQIFDNEWVINPNNYFQRNYDKNGLEVIDEDGITRFQIDFRDIYNIKVGGVFADEENIYFILSPDKNGNPGLITTGLNYITKEKIKTIAKNVPYMFVYPSNKHFGERTK